VRAYLGKSMVWITELRVLRKFLAVAFNEEGYIWVSTSKAHIQECADLSSQL